uniref:Regulator of hemoglobinization and erythroid cell expansion n=1 Tax=Otolemur garnettii TaxID=30611 RepID=H0WK66_OTOGA
MLSEAMNLWQGIVIAAVTLFLQTCLLTAINYLLSRHMGFSSKESLTCSIHPSIHPSTNPHEHHPLVFLSQDSGSPAGLSFLCPSDFIFSDDSDTSSDSSDSSDSSPPVHQATKDVSYTQVVFSAPGGLKNDSARDYENTKEATDYVNVNPKSYTTSFWTFANPSVSEPVEYTQVAM